MKRSGFFLAVMSVLFLASGFPSPAQAEDDRLNPDTAKYQSYDAYVSLYTKDPNSDQEAYAFNMAFSMLNGIPLNAKWEAKGQKEYLMNLAEKKPGHYKVPNAAQLAIATEALSGQSAAAPASTSGQGANSGCYIAKNGDYICENYGAAAAPAATAAPAPAHTQHPPFDPLTASALIEPRWQWGDRLKTYLNDYDRVVDNDYNKAHPARHLEYQQAYIWMLAYDTLNQGVLDTRHDIVGQKEYWLQVRRDYACPAMYRLPREADLAIAARMLGVPLGDERQEGVLYAGEWRYGDPGNAPYNSDNDPPGFVPAWCFP